MPIDKDTVSKVSNLARIKIDNNQLEKISKELEAVMGWIDSLSEVETSGIEPFANVTGQKLPLREDKVTDGGYSDKILNIFEGEDNDFSKAVCLNAAAGLMISEKYDDFKIAYNYTRGFIKSGAAFKYIKSLQNV